jgi:hypothetical protein
MNREFAFFFPVLALILAASVLHAQVPVSAAAVANAFERPIVNKRVNALAIADTTASARNMASTGPRYNVAQFGAVGDGSTDDTAAIQAAYNTCWNGGIGPYGGVVEFPGTKTYVISSTINANMRARKPTATQTGQSKSDGTGRQLERHTASLDLQLRPTTVPPCPAAERSAQLPRRR